MNDKITPRILLIDVDRPEASELEGIIKEAISCRTTIAGGLSAAKRYLDKTEYDLVISDLELPEGSGLDLLPQLQKQKIPPPLIIVTASGGEKIAVEVFKSGALGYVKKGRSLANELVGEVKRVLDRKPGENNKPGRGGKNESVVMELAERTKELDCLYGISKLVEKPGVTLDDILSGTAQLIPSALRYPDAAGARVLVGKNQYTSHGFKKTKNMLPVEIEVHSEIEGMVEVYYPDSVPKEEERFFSKDEETLVWAVAKRLGRVIERSRTEIELEHEKLLTESSLNQLQDLFFVIDLEGRFLRWNNALKEITGYGDKEMREMNIVDLFPEFNVKKAVKHFMKLKPGEARTVEMEIMANGTGKLLFEFDGALLANVEGVTDSFSFIGRDITEHKRTELLLKNQRDLTLQVFDPGSPDEILKSSLNAIIDCAGLDFGAVYFLDETIPEYKCIFVHGSLGLFKEGFSIDALSIFDQTKESPEKPFYLDSEALTKLTLLEKNNRRIVRSAAIIPILDGLKVIGYIVGASTSDDETPGESIDIIDTLAAQCNQTLAMQELQNRLLRSEGKLRNITDSVRDPIFMLNEIGKIVFWNPSAKSMFGYTEDEAIGEGLYSLLSIRGYQETFDREFLEFQVSGSRLETVNALELEATRKDGTVIPIEISFSSIQGEYGWQTVGIARENKERKMIEEEIVKFKNIADRAEYGVMILDVDGNVQYINQYMASIHGYTPKELLLLNFGALYPESEKAEVAAKFSEILKTGTLKSTTSWHRKKDNSIFPMLINATVINNPEGKPLYVATSGIDITQIKEAEGRLNDARKMAEAASSAKSSFLAAISHEIRTPLSGAIGMARVLSETDLSPEQREYTDTIIESSEVLLNIINNILDFATLDASGIEIKKLMFNIHDLSGATVKAFSVRAQEKGLSLVFRVKPEVPPYVVGDPDRLRHIIVNLIGNAIKFTEQGEISLSIEAGSVDSHSATLRFIIKDTGIGIPQDKQEAIFESFTQVDSTWSRKYGGAGLGLSISNQLVSEMNGTMELKSELGKGSVFTFSIPFTLRNIPRIESHIAPSPNLKGMKVLIAEKSEGAGEMMEELLTYWGMLPVVVNDGRETLAAMAEAMDAGNPFSLIILDAELPEVDGFIVAKRISENPSLVESVLFTLNPMMLKDGVPILKQLGIESYLTTPVTPSDLLNGITAAKRITVETPAVKKPPVKKVKTTDSLDVLLAEDTLVNQKLITTLLEKKGHQVTTAGNGKEAVDAAGKKVFDLVLMDVQMPEMDGLEATGIIRKSEKASGKHLPIVALTAHAMKGDKDKCLDAGMDSYLSKPVDPVELYDILDHYSKKKSKKKAG